MVPTGYVPAAGYRPHPGAADSPAVQPLKTKQEAISTLEDVTWEPPTYPSPSKLNPSKKSRAQDFKFRPSSRKRERPQTQECSSLVGSPLMLSSSLLRRIRVTSLDRLKMLRFGTLDRKL